MAAALHFSPVEIYQWVYNHIDFQLYPGLMKGAQATLETRAGSAGLGVGWSLPVTIGFPSTNPTSTRYPSESVRITSLDSQFYE